MPSLLAAKLYVLLLLGGVYYTTTTATTASAVHSSFDCLMRKAAYEYGKNLLPRHAHFLELYYALDLGLDLNREGVDDTSSGSDGDSHSGSDDCHVVLDSRVDETSSSSTSSTTTRRSLLRGEHDSGDETSLLEALPDDAVFVAPPPIANHLNSSSSNDNIMMDRLNELAARRGGSQQYPFYSIQVAVDYAVTSTKSKHVVLRGGAHFLSQTILLTAKHSDLRLAAFPGETPIISGGIPLNNIQEWKPHKTEGSQNIWVTNLAATHPNLQDMPGLQINGQRATRARYPNLPGGIEVSCGYGCMINQGLAQWTPPQFDKYGYKIYYTDTNPNHTRPNGGWFEHYNVGIRGLCSVYDPPVSYWCSEHPSGGGAFAFRTPAGLTPVNFTILPNAPYDPTRAKDDAIVFVWRPARWANWMFALDDYNTTTGNMTFGHGGNQGARGENKGGDWFIENLLEELDHPNEFYFDKRTFDLYLWYNGTGSPPLDTHFVVPQLRTILNITGTQWDPVTNIFVQGVSFRASRYTYMDPHGVPSAGDWALERNAAVFLQGTRHATINKCTMERLDSNGLMISGYNRNTTILDCDFAYIGGTAIASWGFTNETDTDPGRPGIQLENAPFAGVDMTDGEHPRYNRIEGCTAREVGLYEKQSSFYMQAKTVYSTIRGNVFFNGPRAGINLNDGGGGGDEISHNLVFSTCRESGDHGPFNSWDRQPFLTLKDNDPTPSMGAEWRKIHHNFFIDNYSPQENVDNDDGSAYFKTHHNFFVYGYTGQKNDYGGHDNQHFNNIYAYVQQALWICEQLEGHEDVFANNKVVTTGKKVGGFKCDGPGKTILHDNQYFTATGDIQECGMKLTDWQSSGNDLNSTVAVFPSDEIIIGWARALLGF